MLRRWYSRWGDYLPSIVGYSVLAAYLLGPPAALIVALYSLGTGGPVEESPEPDPAAPSTRTACPSPAAVQAVTGFPKVIWDGPLADAEMGRLAGTWLVIRHEWPGLLLSSPSDLVQFRTLTLGGGKCRIAYAPKEDQPTQETDLTAAPTAGGEPAGFDLVGPDGDVRFRCIYRVTEGGLNLAVGLDPKIRPTWERSPMSAVVVLILKREMAEPVAAPDRGPKAGPGR